MLDRNGIFTSDDNRQIRRKGNTFWCIRSKQKAKLPGEYSPDLAYFVGALIGDGTLHSPVSRERGRYFTRVSFVGSQEYMKIIEDLVMKLFGWKPVVYKKKDREKTWKLEMNSLIIHRFLNKALGIPVGKKSGNISFFQNLKVPDKYYKHVLAGLIDTDGYVSNRYIGLIQKDRNFLNEIKHLSEKHLGIHFNGPNINRKIDGIPVGWIISIGKNADKKSFIESVPLRYKKMPL